MGSASTKPGPGPDPGRVSADDDAIDTSSSSSPYNSSSPSPPRSSISYRTRRRRGGRGGGVFRSFCIGSSSTYEAYDSDDLDDNVDQVSDHHNEVSDTHMQQNGSNPNEVKLECFQTAKIDASNDISCVSSNAEVGEWTDTSRDNNNMSSTRGNSSQPFSDQSLNRSDRFLSRFSFVSGSVSFRFNRATSVGSSRAYPSPRNPHIPTDEEYVSNENEHQHCANSNSSSLYRAPSRSNNGGSFNILHNSSGPILSTSLQGDRNVSRPEMAGNDWNVRFSRNLSVGRLRDRVLRRSSFSDSNHSPSHQESTTSFENSVNSLTSSPYPSRIIPRPLYTSPNNDADALHPRETSHRDFLEHRSNFLERRRRIRSQVRAMQRLGNRFENISGHERYCMLSGQHRRGRCSCRIGSRDSNSNGDDGARASISRIMMLAEALFEVLDEIHQQSVVLSSRPSVSSIGSVPAPNEVVELLPVKVFNKSTKYECEEVGQCYICLVEYDQGDEMRVLPCHHEFHKKCIDKWLKEVHRVCPLCRGDICKSDPTPVEA